MYEGTKNSSHDEYCEKSIKRIEYWPSTRATETLYASAPIIFSIFFNLNIL